MVVFALPLLLAGCIGGDGAEHVQLDDTAPKGLEPALNVYDMSGEFPAASVGPGDGTGPLFDVGTVPSGEDDEGTILLDFQPDLGPYAEEVWICIGTYIGTEGGLMVPDCYEAYGFSTGEAVRLDATGLSGKTILVGTDDGAGAGTVYVLCTSVFDFHLPADDYTAIVDGHCRAPTVVDMSGETPDASVGVFGIGSVFDVGTVPSGADDKGTILLDFHPDLGPAAMSVTICIATESIGVADCEASQYSTGEAVRLDATGLSGKTIFMRTDYGAGSGTTYILCASVFDFHPPPDDYTAIVDDHCHNPVAGEEEEEAAPDPTELEAQGTRWTPP